MRGIVGVLCAMATCAAGPAGAAAKGVVVERLPSGTTLSAYDAQGGLCVAVSGNRLSSRDCVTRLPRYAPQVRLGIGGGEEGDEGSVRFGVVPVDVAAVEVEARDGRRIRADTIAGDAYHGRFAGRVRFALVELVGPASLDDLVRYLDAAGNVIGAQTIDRLSGPVTVAPRTFAKTARGTVMAVGTRELAPTPLDLDRTETRACIGLPQGPPGIVFMAAAACAYEGPVPRVIDTGTDARCGGTLITGVAAAGVTGVVAVLGDGRRVRLPLRRLPAHFRQDVRAFVTVLRPETALLRLVARSAHGEVTLPESSPPGSLACFPLGGALSGTNVFDILFGLSTRHHSTPPRLRLRDAGERLCATTGAFDPFGTDCPLPPLTPDESFVIDDASKAGTLVAVVGSPQVASAAVRLAGEQRPRPLPRDDAALAGSHYAGVLPVFVLTLPGKRRVGTVTLTDTRGRTSTRGGFATSPVRPPLPPTVARTGAIRLRAGKFGRDETCLTLDGGDGGFPPHCAQSFPGVPFPRPVGLLATCAPRRLALAVRLPRGAGALGVRLASGATVEAPAVRVPRRLGAGRAALAVLRGHDRPVALTFPGTDRAPRRVRIPSAAAQCGWSGELDVAP